MGVRKEERTRGNTARFALLHLWWDCVVVLDKAGNGRKFFFLARVCHSRPSRPAEHREICWSQRHRYNRYLFNLFLHMWTALCPFSALYFRLMVRGRESCIVRNKKLSNRSVERYTPLRTYPLSWYNLW